MYVSPLFRAARYFAESRFDRWYILSAKYGLLEPHQIIDPYEQTLKQLSRAERSRWAEKVFSRLDCRVGPADIVTFVAGEAYREFLAPKLKQKGVMVTVPLERRSIGLQLQWLKKIQDEPERLKHLDQFYELLTELEKGLGGKRLMRDCTGQMPWPHMGVYFFFETKETRMSAAGVCRAIRVGTHTVSAGSKSSLWQRLRTHRGATDLSGNHRGSIFRLHVGAAILGRDQFDNKPVTWGVGQTSSRETRLSELELETQVSRYIGQMSLLWLAIGDEASPTSDRSYIERNSIGLLAGGSGPIDLPSPTWLGNYSPRDAIRRSGLWNINYVEDQYDPEFLSILHEYVCVTVGRKRPPKHSLAPKGWTSSFARQNRNQLFLFD